MEGEGQFIRARGMAGLAQNAVCGRGPDVSFPVW